VITEEKKRALEAKLASLGIFEKDIEEHFIRSSGHGGQNVNKVSSCVWIKHLPTKLEVKCQKTRSQLDNRYFARQILYEKLDAILRGRESAIAKERHKKRKQKQKRSKRAKDKMLQDKKIVSKKKEWRKSPSFDRD